MGVLKIKSSENKQVKKMSRLKKIIIAVASVLIILVIIEFVISNSVIDVENFTVKSKKIPESFSGTKIVQISDYHGHGGNYEDKLIKTVENQNPDYIFITGDTVDKLKENTDNAKSFLEKISKVGKCYLVWGNHDYEIGQEIQDKLKKCCEEKGITILENDYCTLEKNGEEILLVGTDTTPLDERICNKLEKFKEQNPFTIWLHHYPEDFQDIVTASQKAGCKADLVFTGHAHGGLFRFPFPNGLYAPGQGFLPEYTSGEYKFNDSEMIVSRGVGNSGYTKRFFDNFHLVVCTLER